MTNKIVILDDSVILYEHYISDDQWEKTLAFPRGGLTYLVSNGTIKFYAYEDYFYKNCLISMQLPIYIVDEYMHIDGEYQDITELTEVLDRIFPTNDIDAQLEKYLKIVDAELLYQPIGDYALKSDIPDVSDFITDEDLVEALEDYYTKEESDARFQPKGDYATKDELNLKADKDDVYTKTESDNKYQPKGDYLTTADTYVKSEIDDKLDDKLDVSAYTPCDLSNYYTKSETSGATEISTALARKADKDNVYTKTESDGKYQPKGNYQEKLIAGANITISGNVISASGGGGEPVDAYTKAESDARFQLKGDYATESWVLNKNYITSASTVFNNYYTTANTYNKTEINNYITQLQNQINSLQEALEECCTIPTGSTIYRWVVDPNDYYCLGVNKYDLEVMQQSTDNGRTWTEVVPRNTRMGSNILEYYSTDCGYTGCTPFTATTQGGDILTPDHEEEVDGHLSWNTTAQGNMATNSTAITSVTISDCVYEIDGNAFAPKDSSTNYVNLQTVDIPSSVLRIGQAAFKTRYQDVCRLQRVICRAEYPPIMSADYEYFSTEGGLAIYVPASSVDTYKIANGWSRYADRIQAIPS